MKKKILSIALALCMVLTMMPMATGVAWAAALLEGVTFSHAYDVQRDPAYPTRGETINLSGLEGPIMGSDRTHGDSVGNWTLTKAGTYAYMESSGKATENLTSIVTGIVSAYSYQNVTLDKNTIIIHELKKNGTHLAYGVVVAYDITDGYALFQGDTLSGSGAGYFLSTSEKSGDFSVIASTIVEDNARSLSISLDTSDDFSFGTVNEGYNAEYIESIKKTVTITNTGSAATGTLTVALSNESFEIDGATISGIGDVGGTATFSVYPKVGLSTGTYSAVVTVSGNESQNIDSQSFNVSFTVTSVSPTYSIGLDQSGTYTFDAVTAGYNAQEPLTVTVTNTGTVGTEALKVTLSGDNAGSFTLSTNSIGSISAEEGNKTATFTVAPITGLTAGTYTATVIVSSANDQNQNIEPKSFDVSFKVKAPSSSGSYTPTIQKPTVITDDGAEGTLSFYGDKLTIKVTDDYELADVILNGVSKGKVTELTGLKTGDKVEVKTEKKQEEPKEPTKEEIVAALKEQQLVARSKLTTSKSGRKAVLITWYDKNGNEVIFDGVEIYRSTKRDSGYGDEPIFVSKTGKYYNTAITEGTRYYYKVRGYVIIDGQKYYTDYSLKAIRTVK